MAIEVGPHLWWFLFRRRCSWPLLFIMRTLSYCSRLAGRYGLLLSSYYICRDETLTTRAARFSRPAAGAAANAAWRRVGGDCQPGPLRHPRPGMRAFHARGTRRSDAAPERALSNIVTPGYFRTMAIPLRACRLRGVRAIQRRRRSRRQRGVSGRRYLATRRPSGRRSRPRSEYVIVGVARTSR